MRVRLSVDMTVDGPDVAEDDQEGWESFEQAITDSLEGSQVGRYVVSWVRSVETTDTE